MEVTQKKKVQIPAKLGFVKKSDLVDLIFGTKRRYQTSLELAKLSPTFLERFKPFNQKRIIPISVFREFWMECELHELMEYELVAS